MTGFEIGVLVLLGLNLILLFDVVGEVRKLRRDVGGLNAMIDHWRPKE